MRAFIAIDLPPTVKQAVGSLQARLRSSLPLEAQRSGDVRWTRPDGIHLTLKFLGDIADEQARQLISNLSSLPPIAAFSITAKGFGFFPNRHRPRVLWAGLEAPSDLASLAAQVDATVESVGFSPEARAFTPHLTLARFGTPRPRPAIEEALREVQSQELGAFEVAGYFLFESKLSPGAASVYRKVVAFGGVETPPAGS